MVARLLVFCAFLASCSPLCGQEGKTAEYLATEAERELLDLLKDFQKRYDVLHAEAEKITDEDQRYEHYEKNDPAIEYFPKLLAFESRHAEMPVGLMALRRIVRSGGGDGAVDSPRERGWREAIKRLAGYGNQAVLVDILRYLDNGSVVSEVRTLLQSLCTAEIAAPVVPNFSELMIARCLLAARDRREYLLRRLKELEAGEKPVLAIERQYVEQQLLLYPPTEVKSWEDEALAILRRVAQSGGSLRQPAVVNLDPDWHLISVDAERTKSMPRLSDLAEGELFRQSHLRQGKPAPELKLKLLSGEEWSLSSQRGRAVIIQFSFKGCGACEVMYPILRDIQQTHGPKVSVLTVMTDEERADIESAVADGTMTWNIYWDGNRGSVATRWAIQSFPTVYVVDTKGDIAAIKPRRDELKNKVAELLK